MSSLTSNDFPSPHLPQTRAFLFCVCWGHRASPRLAGDTLPSSHSAHTCSSPQHSRLKPRPLPWALLTSYQGASRTLTLRHRNSRQDLSPSPDRRARRFKTPPPECRVGIPLKCRLPLTLYWNSMQNLKPIASRLY